MNAYYLNKPDGTQTQVSVCGVCGLTAAGFGNYGVSQRCCTCLHCGEALSEDERRSRSLYHPACEAQRNAEFEAKRLEDAELLTDYAGPVYCESAGRGSFGDGYFADAIELAENLDMQDSEDPTPRPAFAFCCEEIQFRGLDIASILENEAEEMFEDAIEHFKGTEELEAAIKTFNEANNSLVSWTPDYKRKVSVPSSVPEGLA